MSKKPVKWLILQLDEECCLEKNYESINSDLLNAFGRNVKTYMPIHSESIGEKTIHTVLFDGYVFVCCTGIPNITTLVNKIRSLHIRGPLYVEKDIQYIDGSEIDRYKKLMEKKLKEFVPVKNQRVVAKVGTYRNMDGEVVRVDRKSMTAVVRFKTRSREVTDTLKLVNLVPIDDSEEDLYD